MTENEIKAALTDALAVPGTIFGEGAGLDRKGREAIASTIRNRYLTPKRFGLTWKNVCLSRAAFSCWWSWGGKENHGRLLNLMEAILTDTPLPLTPKEARVWQECIEIAGLAMTEGLPDRVNHATHYYNPHAMRPAGRVPAWAVGKTPAAVVEPHRFYAGIA